MSYQVLARKWRPSTFAEMVGQSHVLRALVNALDQGRLHHAYLFTGTRGVGKTSIARLLAKSLNCEQGVSSKPCGVCSSCVEISEGRFVDLIEVDAASRTKVEDTRELLDNVQYAPTRGRFKVYLIDEVHMLSTSSFNALLKTLEEPPEHVKFLLATTDPQKLPVTVLSRCLQFNLKNMSRENIVKHLDHILDKEDVAHDEGSLWAIAEAAAGSMRDALSLTDQSIAFGEGQLKEQEVAAMLGTVDLKRVLKLVTALFERNVDALMAMIAEIDNHSPDYMSLMTELMSVLHRTAIAQASPSAIDNSKGDRNAIVQLAGAVQPEDVHLYYQIGAKAKPEMPLAPSERAGFEMALLRMLAFSQTPPADIGTLSELSSAPAEIIEAETTPQSESSNAVVAALEAHPETAVKEAAPVSEPVAEPEPVVDIAPAVNEVEPEVASTELESPAVSVVPEPQVTEVEPDDAPPFDADPVVAEAAPAAQVEEAPRPVAEPSEPASMPAQSPTSPAIPTAALVSEEPEPVNVAPEQAEPVSRPHVAQWPEVNRDEDPVHWWQVTLHRLGLKGMTKTLFANSEWVGFDGKTLTLNISVNYRKIMNPSHQEKLLQVIGKWLEGCQQLAFDFSAVEKTPQIWVDQLVQQAKDQAYDYLQKDSFISALVADYNAELVQDSAATNHNPIPSGE